MNYNIEEILNKVFDVLENEIESGFVIMNKYDEIPKSLPSDIDICINQKEFQTLDKTITNLSKKTGLVIIQKIWHNYRKCAYILSPLKIDYPFRLQLDFFSDFAVKSTPLLIPYNEMLTRTRTYGRFKVPDYELEYVFLLMRRIFKNDFSIQNCDVIRTALISGDIEKTRSYSAKYFDVDFSNKLCKCIYNKDVDELKKMRPQLWTHLKSFSQQNSFIKYEIKYRLNEINRKIYRIKYPVGISIAIISPDGGGKSSVVKELDYICSGSFHGFKRFYFRPRLLKNIGSYNILNPQPESDENPNPHNVKLDSFLKSLVRFFFYNIDFIIGFLILVKPLVIKKYLVVFDRYYYDYFVDMKRYKYNIPAWIPLFFLKIIPKPQIVFVLNGTAEVFYNRKQELSIIELNRQIEKFKLLDKYIDNVIYINANNELNEVLIDIVSEILKMKAVQTAKAMKNILDENFIPV